MVIWVGMKSLGCCNAVKRRVCVMQPCFEGVKSKITTLAKCGNKIQINAILIYIKMAQ